MDKIAIVNTATGVSAGSTGFAACGALVSGFICEIVPGVDDVSKVIQYGAFGVLALCVLFVVWQVVVNLVPAFIAARSRETETFDARLEKILAANKAERDATLKRFEDLVEKTNRQIAQNVETRHNVVSVLDRVGNALDRMSTH
jgi:hypothetical protein